MLLDFLRPIIQNDAYMLKIFLRVYSRLRFYYYCWISYQLVQGIYNSVPEMSNVSMAYGVAAAL